MHWALVPLVPVNLDELGSDPVTAAMGAYNFAGWGLAVGVFLRARGDRRLRGVAGAGTLSGLLGGISEPMLYGVILRYRRVIPIVVGSAVAGGAVVGLLGVRHAALFAEQRRSDPAAYRTAQRIAAYLEGRFDVDLSEEEQLYLMIHLSRLRTREQQAQRTG